MLQFLYCFWTEKLKHELLFLFLLQKNDLVWVF